MKKVLLTAVFLTGLSLPAMAQDAPAVVALPNGQTALNISATETVEVAQDTLVASLRIEVEDKEASKVQGDINKAMEKAVALTKTYPSLRVETGQYYVYPEYNNIKDPATNGYKQDIAKWRGAQTITIKSKESKDVLTAAGKIQDMGFVMNNLNYELSMERYEDMRDSLMERTVNALRARSERVAKALGKATVDIVEINVDSMPVMPQPVMYAREKTMEMSAMAADAAMPAPTAQAGTDTVSMTISARAILK